MACQICFNDDVCDTDKVSCSYCNFGACENCHSKYITLALKEPNCMGCKKVWSREFVMERFDKKWLRQEFLPHMGVLIREQEKILLPETQDEAAMVSKIRSYSAEINDMPTNNKLANKYKKDPNMLEQVLQEKRTKREALKEKISGLKVQTFTYGRHAGSKPLQKSSTSYVLKCPCDDCRGFVSSDYVCGTCSSSICERCHVPTVPGEKHSCDKNDVASASLIKKETKSCPKCMTPIFKISGCSQMFCTQCQTAFDWETGIIEMGILHNPHYYEWLASNSQNATLVEEVACGELPNPHIYMARIQGAENMYKLMNIYRTIHHIRNVLLPKFSTNRVKDNFDLRVQYLLKDFDDEMWKFKLMNREKKRMKIKAIRDLLELGITILTDFVRQVMYTSDFQNVLNQYFKLLEYHESCLDRIAEIHGGSIPIELYKTGLPTDY